jgi:hypothetical protein
VSEIIEDIALGALSVVAQESSNRGDSVKRERLSREIPC